MSQRPDKDLDLPLDDADVHETQRFPRDDDEGGESPDFLAAPKRGKGVRRLNRLPLVVVGILILLAVAGITYTFFARQAANVAPATPLEPPKVTTTAAPPVRPPRPPEPTAFAPAESESGPMSGMGSVPTERNSSNNSSQPAPVSEAMTRRLRQIQQLEDKKLTKADEALYADAAVEEFTKSNPSGVQQSGGAAVANRLNPQELMQQYLANSGQPGTGGGSGAGSYPGMDGMGGPPSMAAENRQDQKRAFLSGTAEASTYLAQQKKAAIAPSQEIKAGWVIPGTMIGGLNSDLPGQIIGQVREAVYDSATGTQCLIPPGSRLVGTYDSGVTLGQTRALAAWQRIIYPDGSSISIDKMPGADQGGYAGFYDQVNNHYLKIFGAGAMLSIFSAGIQLSQPQASGEENTNSSQIIAGALGQQMGQIGMQMAQKNMNIQPTLEIRNGYQFNIMVTKDILLPTWEGHPMAGANNKACE
jgi:type IV secretion system protein VirB10